MGGVRELGRYNGDKMAWVCGELGVSNEGVRNYTKCQTFKCQFDTQTTFSGIY